MRAGGEECFHAVSAGVGRTLWFVGRKAEGITVLERFRVVLKSPEQGQCVSSSVAAVKSGTQPENCWGRYSDLDVFVSSLVIRTASKDSTSSQGPFFASLRAPLC